MGSPIATVHRVMSEVKPISFTLAQKDNAAEFGHIPPSLILGCKPAQTGVDRWDQLYWL